MKLGVYLVEDSDIMSTLLQELLESSSAWIVGRAESARTAIADIGRVRPDVVIIDIALRQGNGFDVLKWLREEPMAKQPLRIVLTNYTLTSYRNAAKRLGADYFFDKSNEIPQLLRVLRSISRKAERVKRTS